MNQMHKNSWMKKYVGNCHLKHGPLTPVYNQLSETVASFHISLPLSKCKSKASPKSVKLNSVFPFINNNHFQIIVMHWFQGGAIDCKREWKTRNTPFQVWLLWTVLLEPPFTSITQSHKWTTFLEEDLWGSMMVCYCDSPMYHRCMSPS